MPKVKIFLPTYKRNILFKRSVNSLLQQTYQDWECEVCNDDPSDDFPKNYINSLNDDRFTFLQHEINLGPVATFNKMFNLSSATYLCLLEDDNWWEKDFLTTMVGHMEKNPDSIVAFSNFNIWQELEGNKWEKLPEPRWPKNSKITKVNFPSFGHIYDYHHSNCSMMIRNNENLINLKAPHDIRIDFIEAIRERALKHPILFINVILANFSLTVSTVRKSNLDGVFEHYLLLIDSFFTAVKIDEKYIKLLWAAARENTTKSFNKLIYTGLICKNSRKLLKEATLCEWIFFFMYNFKHPLIFIRCLTAKKRYHILWQYLLLNTQNRIDESEIKQIA